MSGQNPPDPSISTDDTFMTPPRATATPAPPTAPRAAAPAAPQPYAAVGRSRNEGHGKRLTAAFEALEVFPALAESRNRLLALVSEERPSVGDMVRAIESDVALVIAVLRVANGFDSPRRGAHAGGAPALRARGVGRRPRAGGRRPRPPLEPPEGGGERDRAPPRRR